MIENLRQTAKVLGFVEDSKWVRKGSASRNLLFFKEILLYLYTVNVAEWLRRRIVVPVHVGSNPTVHPE